MIHPSSSLPISSPQMRLLYPGARRWLQNFHSLGQVPRLSPLSLSEGLLLLRFRWSSGLQASLLRTPTTFDPTKRCLRLSLHHHARLVANLHARIPETRALSHLTHDAPRLHMTPRSRGF